MTRPIITSTANQSVKFAKRVRDGKEPDRIFIEGARLFEEALSSNVELKAIFATERYYSANTELFDGDQKIEHLLTVVSEQVLRSMAETKSPQGVICLAKRPHSGFDDIQAIFNTKGKLAVVVYLYNIANPANLGAIIRTAEAAGASGVITSDNSADAFSPASLRGSMGSAFRLPVIENVAMDSAVKFARDNQAKLASVDIKGDRGYAGVDWSTPRMLIFGSEAHGLPDDILSFSDEMLTIEMSSPVESLNLAVSAGIILFEARRQLCHNK